MAPLVAAAARRLGALNGSAGTRPTAREENLAVRHGRKPTAGKRAGRRIRNIRAATRLGSPHVERRPGGANLAAATKLPNPPPTPGVLEGAAGASHRLGVR